MLITRQLFHCSICNQTYNETFPEAYANTYTMLCGQFSFTFLFLERSDILGAQSLSSSDGTELVEEDDDRACNEQKLDSLKSELHEDVAPPCPWGTSDSTAIDNDAISISFL